MKEFLTLRSKMLYCTIREWNVTLVFWGIVVLVEVVINVLK
jgi:hypothetical protein